MCVRTQRYCNLYYCYGKTTDVGFSEVCAIGWAEKQKLLKYHTEKIYQFCLLIVEKIIKPISFFTLRLLPDFQNWRNVNVGKFNFFIFKFLSVCVFCAEKCTR